MGCALVAVALAAAFRPRGGAFRPGRPGDPPPVPLAKGRAHGPRGEVFDPGLRLAAAEPVPVRERQDGDGRPARRLVPPVAARVRDLLARQAADDAEQLERRVVLDPRGGRGR